MSDAPEFQHSAEAQSRTAADLASRPGGLEAGGERSPLVSDSQDAVTSSDRARWTQLLFEPVPHPNASDGDSHQSQKYSVLSDAEFIDDGVVLGLVTVSATEKKDGGWTFRPTEPAVCLEPFLLRLQEAKFRLVPDSSERSDRSTRLLELAWPGFFSAKYSVDADALDDPVKDASLTPKAMSMYASNKLKDPKVSLDPSIMKTGRALLHGFFQYVTETLEMRSERTSGESSSRAGDARAPREPSSSREAQRPSEPPQLRPRTGQLERREATLSLGRQLSSVFQANGHLPRDVESTEEGSFDLGSRFRKALHKRSCSQPDASLPLDCRVGLAAAETLFDTYLPGKGPGKQHQFYVKFIERGIRRTAWESGVEVSALDILSCATGSARPVTTRWGIDDLQNGATFFTFVGDAAHS